VPEPSKNALQMHESFEQDVMAFQIPEHGKKGGRDTALGPGSAQLQSSFSIADPSTCDYSCRSFNACVPTLPYDLPA